jgi:hypothetical protein
MAVGSVIRGDETQPRRLYYYASNSFLLATISGKTTKKPLTTEDTKEHRGKPGFISSSSVFLCVLCG